MNSLPNASSGKNQSQMSDILMDFLLDYEFCHKQELLGNQQWQSVSSNINEYNVWIKLSRNVSS